MLVRAGGIAAAAVALAVAAAQPACAQRIGPVVSTPGAGAVVEDDGRKETVLTRRRPQLDPLGVRLGSFLLYPSLAVEEEYTDNVFKTENGTRDDFVTHFKPAARLLSDWSNHALEAEVRVDAARFADITSEDYLDYAASLGGRVDVTRATNLLGGVQFEHLHEDRGTPDGSLGETPTEFDRFSANLSASHRFNRLSVLGEARLFDLDYDDVFNNVGAVINNDDRDRRVYVVGAKASYEIVPRYEAYLRASYNRRDYVRDTDDFGLDRDSDGFEIVAGTELDLTGITFGNVFAGYREQGYEDGALGTIGGVTFGAKLTSNITPLTTLQLTVDREIEETSIAAAEGYWSTGARLTADHELLRSLILSAGVAYANYDYRGIDREDDTLRTSFGGTYKLNRYLALTGGYALEWRESGGGDGGVDYLENRFLVRLTGTL